MFLITFVTLIISIIGLYAQVLSLQASKIYKAQNGLMQTMVDWHNSALTLAKNYTPSTVPCIIPSDYMQTMQATLSNQPYPITTSTCANVAPPVTTLVLTPTGATPTLPPGYMTKYFSFYSIVFQSGSIKYLLTYAYYTDAANAPSGNLYLPANGTAGASVGYSLNSLEQQFARAATVGTLYGKVTGSGILSVLPQTIGVTGPMIEYTIPDFHVIPIGSLGIISPLS